MLAVVVAATGVSVVVGAGVTSPLLVLVVPVVVLPVFAPVSVVPVLLPVSVPEVPTSFAYGIRWVERARRDERLPARRLLEPLPDPRSTSPEDVLPVVPFSALLLPFLGQFVPAFAPVVLPLFMLIDEPEALPVPVVPLELMVPMLPLVEPVLPLPVDPIEPDPLLLALPLLPVLPVLPVVAP